MHKELDPFITTCWENPCLPVRNKRWWLTRYAARLKVSIIEGSRGTGAGKDSKITDIQVPRLTSIKCAMAGFSADFNEPRRFRGKMLSGSNTRRRLKVTFFNWARCSVDFFGNFVGREKGKKCIKISFHTKLIYFCADVKKCILYWSKTHYRMLNIIYRYCTSTIYNLCNKSM